MNSKCTYMVDLHNIRLSILLILSIIIQTSIGERIDIWMEEVSIHHFIYGIILIFVVPELINIKKLVLFLFVQLMVGLFLNKIVFVSLVFIPVAYYLDKLSLKNYNRHVIIAYGSDIFLTKLIYPNDDYSNLNKYDFYYTLMAATMVAIILFLPIQGCVKL